MKHHVRAISTITTITADVMPDSWLRLPACAAAAVFDRLPATAIPPDTPAPTLAPPMAINSRSVLTR